MSQLSASLEDYMEAVYRIIKDKKAVRPTDIALELGVKNSSVTSALKALSERKLINHVPYDVITLTSAGEKIASEIVRRHEVIRDFFIKVLSVDPAQADETACRIEHVISSQILEKFIDFINFLDVCPLRGFELVKGIEKKCHQDISRRECGKCLKAFSGQLEQKLEQLSKPPVQVRVLDLGFGQKGRVVSFVGDVSMRKRVDALGVKTGDLIEVESGCGNFMMIKVRGYHIGLDKDEARCIMVEAI